MISTAQSYTPPATPAVERCWTIDTETTGTDVSDGDRIIEIGAVEIVNRVRTGRTFHSFVNPEGRRISYGSFQVHGIHDSVVEKAPLFKDVYPKFLAVIGHDPIIIHNADFDMGFINDACRRDGLPLIANPVIDSVETAKLLWPGQTVNLDAIANRFDLYDPERAKKHSTILDCTLLAEVWIRMLAKRENPESQTDLFSRPAVTADLTAPAVHGWSTKLL